MSAADPARPSAGFVGALTVTWWAKDARGCWAQVSHQPLELAFADAGALRVALLQYARAEHWDKVQAVRTDLGLTTVLYSAERAAAGRAVDFEAQATRFLRTLRAAKRSRCAVLVWLRAGHC